MQAEGQYKILRGGDKCLFQCPTDLVADIHGRVYVSDPCSGSVLVFDRDTSFLGLLVDGGKNPVVQRPGSPPRWPPAILGDTSYLIDI